MYHDHRRILAILIALALVAVPALAVPAMAADGGKAEHRRIVRFWTPERQRAAIPRDFVRTARGFVPAAKPDGAGGKKPGGGGGTGDGGGAGTVTGALWNGGGAVQTAVGKVFFRMAGTLYTCSGSVTNDSRGGFSLVLTAAHCAYDERNAAFATEWLFIPDYEAAPTRSCELTAHGCWTAQALVVHQGYADQGTFNAAATRYDFAFAVVGKGGKGADPQDQLDATVGSFPITFAASGAGTTMAAFGYPAAQKYKGDDLAYCQGPIFFDGANGDATYGMSCDMTGGSSGGPWYAPFTGGSGTQASLNSYGYRGGDAMYGPTFNAATNEVYAAADSATDQVSPVG